MLNLFGHKKPAPAAQPVPEGKVLRGGVLYPADLDGILEDPALSEAFREFCDFELATDCLNFYIEAQPPYLHKLSMLLERFIKDEKPETINISADQRNDILTCARRVQRAGLYDRVNYTPLSRAIAVARREMANILQFGPVPRFYNSEIFEAFQERRQRKPRRRRFFRLR